MAVYTVHEPPLRRYEDRPDPQKFVFVRDGFHFWAFLLSPLWMLRHRMWVVLLGYAAVIAILEIAMQWTHASGAVQFGVFFLLALLVGFEAGTLRRFTLGRRKFRMLGFVLGDGRETAEQRFFAQWVKHAQEVIPVPPPPGASAPFLPGPAGGPAIIGLFPEAGAPR